MKRMSAAACVLVTFFVSTARAESLLRPHDRLAICGDSMPHSVCYPTFIEDYLVMAQPVEGLDIAQFGWAGHDPSLLLARLDAALLPYKPDIVLLSFSAGDVNTRERVQTELVRALKKAGVRAVVVGSPPCVDSVHHQGDPAKASAENARRGRLADIDRDVAAKEGAVYADVYGATVAAMKKLKAEMGANYGFDVPVEHPQSTGRDLIMAYAFLKALGCDGNVGTITIDYRTCKAEGSPGQKIVSCEENAVTVESSRPPFHFPGYPSGQPDPDPIVKCSPFNEEINRYTVVVKNLPTQYAEIFWGVEHHSYSTRELEKGVNLTANMLNRVLAPQCENIGRAVYDHQRQERLAGEALLAGNPDPDAGAKRAAAIKAVRDSVAPIRFRISVQPLASPARKRRGAIPVIFETDLAGDVDDAGALAVLHKLADEGRCEILACCGNALDINKASAAAIDVINTYYGRPDIPIGMYHGNAYGGRRYPNRYTAGLRDEFPQDAKPDDQQPSAVEVYRKTLAAAKARSVKIISVGLLINLEDLLKSRPDDVSPLSGTDLVKEKVRELVVMGGAYPQGMEWNFNGYDSGPHTRYVVENWPTPVVFSGFEIGGAIITGIKIASTRTDNPVRRAYELFNNFTGRQSWDLTAVLAAVEDPTFYWAVGCGGYCEVAPNGASKWHAKPDRGHSYLIEKMPSADVARILDDILDMPPRRR